MHGSHIYTALALGRGRVASPTLGCLYPKSHWYSLYRRLNGPHDLSEVKINLHPFDTRDRTWAIQLIAKPWIKIRM